MGSINRRRPFYSDDHGSTVHRNDNKGPSPIYRLVPSLVNLFSNEGWLGIEGTGGLYAAGLEVVLILRASWFSRSSWIRAKEIAAFTVRGYRALTSPLISGMSPSMNAPNNYDVVGRSKIGRVLGVWEKKNDKGKGNAVKKFMKEYGSKRFGKIKD
ncbi:hypothetical protein BHE74_00019216 [Ensete ventricosum]|nr:hypothetical protein BHE74_00019216 [Ensete ventricosum]